MSAMLGRNMICLSTVRNSCAHCPHFHHLQMATYFNTTLSAQHYTLDLWCPQKSRSFSISTKQTHHTVVWHRKIHCSLTHALIQGEQVCGGWVTSMVTTGMQKQTVRQIYKLLDMDTIPCSSVLHHVQYTLQHTTPINTHWHSINRVFLPHDH